MITLEYSAQARQAAGCERDMFEPADATTIEVLVRRACDRHGETLSSMLLHEGSLAPWVLVSVNGTAIQDADALVGDGDVVRLLSPISGG